MKSEKLEDLYIEVAVTPIKILGIAEKF